MRLIILVLFLLITPTASYGEQFQVLASEGVTVWHDPALSSVSARVAQIFPKIKSELEAVIGWDMPATPTVVLINDTSLFQNTAESPLTMAYANPLENSVVIDYSRVSIHPFTLDAILEHELCHLLLHDHIPIHHLPRWFDEGVCQWVSDGIVDIMIQQKRSILEIASMRNSFIPLRSLQTMFPRDEKILILAYEQSRSLVDYIIIRFGKDGLLSILEQLKAGQKMDAAVNDALYITLNDLEYEWHESLRSNLAWFTYFSYHIYEIIFTLLALIAMIGFIRIMIKKRSYTDELP